LEHCPIVLVLRKTKSCQAFVPSIRSIKPADNLVSLTEHERTGGSCIYPRDLDRPPRFAKSKKLTLAHAISGLANADVARSGPPGRFADEYIPSTGLLPKLQLFPRFHICESLQLTWRV
jgi:hypothetical protein